MPSEVIELSGHIIDSWTLPRAWDIIMDRGGNFAVESAPGHGTSIEVEIPFATIPKSALKKSGKNAPLVCP